MSRTSSTARSTNFPLILLWAASIAVIVIGYLVMTMAIATQTDLYGSGSQDVQALLNGQAGVTLGTTLVGVGVLGILIALAVHARNASANRVHVADNGFDDDLDDDLDESTDRPAAHAAASHVAAEPAAPTTASPVASEPVPAAPAAVEPTAPPAAVPSAPPVSTPSSTEPTSSEPPSTVTPSTETPSTDTTGDQGTTPPPRP